MRSVIAAALAAAAISGAAHAGAPVTLAEWTFESSVPINAGPHTAEGGLNAAFSLATASHASAATVYSNPVGNGTPESFSSNNWAIGDYYQFSTSTLGYQSINIQWEQTRSSTGPELFDLAYSTDGATFFNLVTAYSVPAITWSSVPANFQPGSVFGPEFGPAALDDQGTVWFRLIAASSPGSTAGSNRIDNVIISGTLIPTPGATALFAVAGLVAARRRRA